LFWTQFQLSRQAHFCSSLAVFPHSEIPLWSFTIYVTLMTLFLPILNQTNLDHNALYHPVIIVEESKHIICISGGDGANDAIEFCGIEAKMTVIPLAKDQQNFRFLDLLDPKLCALPLGRSDTYKNLAGSRKRAFAQVPIIRITGILIAGPLIRRATPQWLKDWFGIWASKLKNS
jgi:hypothetical protein